jgi:flagellar FliJ protein
MARFRYSLQSILNIKMKMETQAKQEFSAAMGALSEEEKKLEQYRESRKLMEEEGVSLRSGILDFRKIEDNSQSVAFMDQRILIQKDNIRIAEKNVENARAKLAQVMMERKTHETLREKAFEQFMKDENRAESKSVDELTSYTYGQKKKTTEKI